MPRQATLRRYNGYWFTQAGSRQGTYFGRVDEVPYQEAKRRFGESRSFANCWRIPGLISSMRLQRR